MTAHPVHARAQLSLTFLVATAFFMEQLDGTIVANAAPSIGRSLGVQSSGVAVTMTAYLVTLAALIPLSGWIADRFGARRVFTAAVLVFTVASALCAVSQSLGMLVGMRILQAAGGALMVPVGRLVVLRATDRADLIRAIAYLTWPALLAPVIAPVLAGVFTTYLTWRWIFLVNVPLGVIALIWAWRVVPDVRGSRQHRLDWAGFVLAAICVGSLTYLAAILSENHIDVIDVVVLALVSVLTGVLTVLHLLRARHPLLQLRILRVRTFRLSNASGSIYRLTVLGVPFLLPLMFQDGFGWSPIKAGAMVLFVFVGNVAIKPATTPLLRHFGFKTVLLVAIVAMAASMAACAAFSPGTPLVVIALVLLVGGIFRSTGFTVYNTIAFSDIDDGDKSPANTLSSTIQQLALGLGIAVGSVALRIGQAGQALGPHSVVTPYRIAFVLMAVLTATAIFEALRLPGDAGANIGGGTTRRTRRPRIAAGS
jgi:EmrB/QacA subfamily drug resistance transporter